MHANLSSNRRLLIQDINVQFRHDCVITCVTLWHLQVSSRLLHALEPAKAALNKQLGLIGSVKQVCIQLLFASGTISNNMFVTAKLIAECFYVDVVESCLSAALTSCDRHLWERFLLTQLGKRVGLLGGEKHRGGIVGSDPCSITWMQILFCSLMQRLPLQYAISPMP